MVIVTGVGCQGANGRERLPQDSICAQAHTVVILCRVAFRRESIITRRFPGGSFSNVEASPGSIWG
jgi:hypothetical protein